MQIRKALSTLLAIVGITMFAPHALAQSPLDRKSTRLNSSH